MCSVSVYALIGHTHLSVTAGGYFLEVVRVSSPDGCFGWRDLSLRMVVCFFQDCLVSLFCLCMRTCVISCLSSKLFFLSLTERSLSHLCLSPGLLIDRLPLCKEFKLCRFAACLDVRTRDNVGLYIAMMFNSSA